MKEKNIQILVERFLNGETSLEEERYIYDKFKVGDIPAELKEYRDMFLDFEAARLPKEGKRVNMAVVRRLIISVAACAVILIGATLAYQKYSYSKLESIYGGSYMIVNGQRNDNLREIHSHIKKVLAESNDIERRVTDMENPERQVLNGIQDPETREYVRQLIQD